VDVPGAPGPDLAPSFWADLSRSPSGVKSEAMLCPKGLILLIFAFYQGRKISSTLYLSAGGWYFLSELIGNLEVCSLVSPGIWYFK
jgi:hypothetical protein